MEDPQIPNYSYHVLAFCWSDPLNGSIITSLIPGIFSCLLPHASLPRLFSLISRSLVKSNTNASMNKTINNNNYASQLADDFNRFYIHITDRTLHQVGNYRIAHEIGEGSFGKAYLAHHVLLNTPVVLKSGLIDDPNIVREIYYHKQLKHRNIVRLYEVIKTETHLWLVMEYCQGNELYYLIYENRRLEYKQTQHLFFQIIQATKYVHSLNLAHRDLKLENILLADKKKSIIKLTDFGFVREFSPASRRLLSTMCGTTVYMAPEVLCGQKYNGFSADIWSLGIILYTMLYGQMPFEEDDELRTKYKIIHESPT
ncbi:kinase-like protein, partial [Yamadazyma tenuis ATCC 10573]